MGSDPVVEPASVPVDAGELPVELVTVEDVDDEAEPNGS